ncbi:MAG: TlpA family protein disulfide reductase [Gemmatimonadales bacterium]
MNWTAGRLGGWTAGNPVGAECRVAGPPSGPAVQPSSRRTLRFVRFVLFALLARCPPVSAQLEAGIAVGATAPAVIINDLDGRPVDLGGVLGKKPVLLEFWATWCSLCKALLHQLDAVHEAYGDRLAMFGVNVTVNESKARIRRYLEEHRPPFQVLYDEKGAGVRAYDVPSTSFIVVIDSAGKVVYTGSGEKQDLLSAVGRAFPKP